MRKWKANKASRSDNLRRPKAPCNSTSVFSRSLDSQWRMRGDLSHSACVAHPAEQEEGGLDRHQVEVRLVAGDLRVDRRRDEIDQTLHVWLQRAYHLSARLVSEETVMYIHLTAEIGCVPEYARIYRHLEQRQ